MSCETNLEWIFVISLLQSEFLRYEWHASFRSLSFLQVKYTQGGLENLELSRKYFAQALKLNNRNMRALFGLYMVSTIIYFPCYNFEYVSACVLSFAICCFVFSPSCFNLIAQIINTALKYEVFYILLEYGQFCASKYSLLEVLLTFKSCLYFQKNYNYWHRKVTSWKRI